MRRMVTMGLLFALAGCASGRFASRSGVPGYAGGNMSCVPFARERSGLRIAGDAWQWWQAAAEQYERSRMPFPGSVLVFQRTSRNPRPEERSGNAGRRGGRRRRPRSRG